MQVQWRETVISLPSHDMHCTGRAPTKRVQGGDYFIRVLQDRSNEKTVIQVGGGLTGERNLTSLNIKNSKKL